MHLLNKPARPRSQPAHASTLAFAHPGAHFELKADRFERVTKECSAIALSLGIAAGITVEARPRNHSRVDFLCHADNPPPRPRALSLRKSYVVANADYIKSLEAVKSMGKTGGAAHSAAAKATFCRSFYRKAPRGQLAPKRPPATAPTLAAGGPVSLPGWVYPETARGGGAFLRTGGAEAFFSPPPPQEDEEQMCE